MKFAEAFARVVGIEGGFDKSPDDKGNWTGGKVGVGVLKGTKFGISAASYPAEDIERLTLARAQELYQRDYWRVIRADDLPEALRYDLFDLAVNSGTGAAGRILQRALGIKEDGSIGPMTLAAVAMLPVDRIRSLVLAHRLILMTEATLWSTRARGWVRRAALNVLET